MTRAVTFNGSTQLLNGSIGKSPPFTFPLGSGILSYWYRAANQSGGVIFLAYANYPLPLQGHHVRMVHVKGRASSPYPILSVQNPTLPGNTANAIFDGGPLPADNDWHHMAFSWNVNVFPYEFEWALDGVYQPAAPTPPFTNAVAFTVPYANADMWAIGAEDIIPAPPPPLYLDAFTGDLAEVFFQARSTYRSILGVAGATITTPWGVWNWGGRGFTTDDGYAQEIGPDGTGAYGELPQIYLADDNTTFPVNAGLSGGTYAVLGGLSAALTDPFS